MKKAAAKNAKDAKKKTEDKQRGTQNELEIVGLIVLESPVLRQAVMEKMKQLKERQKSKTQPGATADARKA
jgi:hypothetical protein